MCRIQRIRGSQVSFFLFYTYACRWPYSLGGRNQLALKGSWDTESSAIHTMHRKQKRQLNKPDISPSVSGVSEISEAPVPRRLSASAFIWRADGTHAEYERRMKQQPTLFRHAFFWSCLVNSDLILQDDFGRVLCTIQAVFSTSCGHSSARL